MDGRDEENTNSAENQANVPGAIFTPQEELIEVEETTPTVDNPQPVTPVPVRSNATTASGTGDIKLQKPKKSHKGLIAVVIVLILAVAAGGFGIWWALGREGAASSPLQAFESYKEYLVNGPEQGEGEGETADETNWLIFRLDKSTIKGEKQKEYSEELLVRYDNFKKVFGEKKEALANTNEIDRILPGYEAMLDAILASNTLSSLSIQLQKEYGAGDSEKAKTYVSSVLARLSDDKNPISVAQIKVQLGKYLNSDLTVLEIYKSADCLDGNIVNLMCSNETLDGNTVLPNVKKERSNAAMLIQRHSEVLQPFFIQQTNELVELLKVVNEK